MPVSQLFSFVPLLWLHDTTYQVGCLLASCLIIKYIIYT
uniref:Uncharacterized protein n=1 Tax=Siphoviridae sp. ctMRT7 TaxID=2827855 RepID=A0A8S5SRN2_9CAUD|nr:MAG TPA: hypothetical protein [Siphoviridae sp. ctMRT7]